MEQPTSEPLCVMPLLADHAPLAIGLDAALLDRLQTAAAGDAALDADMADLFWFVGTCARQGGICTGAVAECDGWSTPDPSRVRWSEDLTRLLARIPGDHNFSIGERDGVRWAWIQPNDGWTPGPNEMRHDHPRGSGLVVAQTMPLALASALVSMLERTGKHERPACFRARVHGNAPA